MRKLLMIFFICIFSLSTACRSQERYTIKLGKTTLHLRDMPIVNGQKELECIQNFIKGRYVDFSQNLKYCTYLGLEDAKTLDILNASQIEAIGISGNFGEFSISKLAVSSYLGFYDFIIKNTNIGEQIDRLIVPEVILSSESRMFLSSFNSRFYGTLPYELLLLRAVYMFAVNCVNKIVMNEIDRVLDFKAFYTNWDQKCTEYRVPYEKLHSAFYLIYAYKYDDILLKMADDLLREIRESECNVHEDFIRFKEAIDEGDLFKAIKFEPEN